MTNQALIYKKPVPVSKQRHATWSVVEGKDYSFSSGLNAVPLVTEEFVAAGREYPVVFVKNGDQYTVSALLGLRNDENLFVDKDGKWLGTYVPAFLRRYPFVFSHSPGSDSYTFCIDEEASGAGDLADGEPLFTKKGQETDYFNKMLSFTKRFQKAVQDTEAFCARLGKLDLIADSEVSFKLPSGEKAKTKGFGAVDRDRLSQLEATDVGQLFADGDLESIYLHLASLRSFDELLHDLPNEPKVLN